MCFVCAHLLLYGDCSSLVVLRQVLTWDQADHVSVCLRTRYAYRCILGVQYEGPSIRSVSVFEERHSIGCTRNSLMASIRIDIWVVLDLEGGGFYVPITCYTMMCGTLCFDIMYILVIILEHNEILHHNSFVYGFDI